MSKPSEVIVVLEDNHQQRLIYRYLIKRGLNRHAIRIESSPSGKGSAESWVRERFPQEVSTYRRRRGRAKSALIVIIDADSSTVQDRLNQLDEVLRQSNMDHVDASAEQIARLAPRRNVETWILCLNGENVDEETDYKRTQQDWSNLIPTAAETLNEWSCLGDPPVSCVSSLRAGIGELVRLAF